MHATVVLGPPGRLVIPADVRAELGLAAGDRLHLQISGRRLVIESQKDAAAELRGLASGVVKSRSLVDELLAERRRTAASGYPSSTPPPSPRF
jgi:AbrB family looped-hinge helix DNA binding protein